MDRRQRVNCLDILRNNYEQTTNNNNPALLFCSLRVFFGGGGCYRTQLMVIVAAYTCLSQFQKENTYLIDIEVIESYAYS